MIASSQTTSSLPSAPDRQPPPSAAGALRERLLGLDYDAEADRIASRLRDAASRDLGRRGLVVGLSGGVDSSVTAALAARALGPERVFGLFMPEHDSDPESLRLGRALAEHLGIDAALEDIAPALEALGCYRRQEEAIREVVPEYGPGWRCKLTLSQNAGFQISNIVVQPPQGAPSARRLTARAYREIVAASAMKQRVRKLIEYTHADRLGYAVAGTPNRLEDDQAFFVKNGDGAADVKPIAHLYKSQVYAMARRLGLPEEICARAPTTDTWSLPQSQEEYYFGASYAVTDLCMAAMDAGLAPRDVAEALGASETEVAEAQDRIARKRLATRYLKAEAVRMAR